MDPMKEKYPQADEAVLHFISKKLCGNTMILTTIN
jgi:hypothetical protein